MNCKGGTGKLKIKEKKKEATNSLAQAEGRLRA
jgi:hypothetical protein